MSILTNEYTHVYLPGKGTYAPTSKRRFFAKRDDDETQGEDVVEVDNMDLD